MSKQIVEDIKEVVKLFLYSDSGEVSELTSSVEVITSMLASKDDPIACDEFIIATHLDSPIWGLASGSTKIELDKDELNSWIAEYDGCNE